MTALDLINKLNKDVWSHSDKLFGDVFENMFDNFALGSAAKTFPFYNVVKYGKGEYGLELGLAGFNKKNVKVQYKDGVLSVSGQVDDSEKEYVQKAIQEIQNPDSQVRFIVGTPQTGGYGITLTGASTMIYYSNGYDLEKRQQSEARIDRIGQEKPMTYIDLLAEGTIDEKIVKALRNKVNIATEIMGEELKEWI